MTMRYEAQPMPEHHNLCVRCALEGKPDVGARFMVSGTAYCADHGTSAFNTMVTALRG